MNGGSFTARFASQQDSRCDHENPGALNPFEWDFSFFSCLTSVGFMVPFFFREPFYMLAMLVFVFSCDLLCIRHSRGTRSGGVLGFTGGRAVNLSKVFLVTLCAQFLGGSPGLRKIGHHVDALSAETAGAWLTP
jgi:hypothetical protein